MSLLSGIAKGFGWTPIGKPVEIKIDTARYASLSGLSISGTIKRIDTDGSAIVRLTSPLQMVNHSFARVMAQPRHQGFDIYHLLAGSIAVDLSPTSAGEDPQAVDARFASGVLRTITAIRGRSE